MPPIHATRRFQLMLMAPGVAAALVSAAVFALLFPPLLRQGVSEALLASLDALAPLVARQPVAAGAALQDWVLGTAGEAGVRLTVIDGDGTVLADSALDWRHVQRVENHASREEVAAALATGAGSAVRRSATTGDPYVYAARRVVTAQGRLLVVRAARPLRALGNVYAHQMQVLIASLLAAGRAAAAVAAWFRRRVLAPFLSLVADSEQLAGAQPGRRLGEPPVKELASLARSFNRMAARVEEQVTGKEAERRQLEEILAAMGEGVLVTDGEGRPVFANAAFRELLRLPAAAPAPQLLALARNGRLQELLRAALSGTSASEEIAAGGRTLAVAARPLGTRGGALLVVRDLSTSERAARTRRDFVANISHELKTPLAVIRGAAETLADHAEGEEDATQRFTGRILEQCLRLQELLEDLLTLARLESPEASARRQPVDLAAVLGRAVEVERPLAEAKGVSLRATLAPVPSVEGDGTALERMALNLLDNAIKYNRPGGWVEARLQANDGEILLEVTDGGAGIAESDLGRIFERFYRVDKGRGRGEGGSGLGLAIVKHVAENHGGRVEVESTAGLGSRFCVRLPLR
jgi:two-component system phosphate regulon sensor histidine kinase PhoR